MKNPRAPVAMAVFAWMLASAPAPAAGWAGGLMLISGLPVTVDADERTGGPLTGSEKIETGSSEARLYARGAAGQGLAVLAPGTSVKLSGSATSGYGLDVSGGAVRIVLDSPGETPILSVEAQGKDVDLPGGGGVVVLRPGSPAEVHPLGSPDALALFPEGADAAARSLGLPDQALPLVEEESGGGEDGESGSSSGGAEVEGESKCMDSATGPEGTDPTVDGSVDTQIDRTMTRVKVKLSW